MIPPIPSSVSMPFRVAESETISDLKSKGLEIKAGQDCAIFAFQGRTYTVKIKLKHLPVNGITLVQSDWERIAEKVIVILDKKHLLQQASSSITIDRKGVHLKQAKAITMLPHSTKYKKEATQRQYGELTRFIAGRIFEQPKESKVKAQKVVTHAKLKRACVQLSQVSASPAAERVVIEKALTVLSQARLTTLKSRSASVAPYFLALGCLVLTAAVAGVLWGIKHEK